MSVTYKDQKYNITLVFWNTIMILLERREIIWNIEIFYCQIISFTNYRILSKVQAQRFLVKGWLRHFIMMMKHWLLWTMGLWYVIYLVCFFNVCSLMCFLILSIWTTSFGRNNINHKREYWSRLLNTLNYFLFQFLTLYFPILQNVN